MKRGPDPLISWNTQRAENIVIRHNLAKRGNECCLCSGTKPKGSSGHFVLQHYSTSFVTADTRQRKLRDKCLILSLFRWQIVFRLFKYVNSLLTKVPWVKWYFTGDISQSYSVWPLRNYNGCTEWFTVNGNFYVHGKLDAGLFWRQWSSIDLKCIYRSATLSRLKKRIIDFDNSNGMINTLNYFAIHSCFLNIFS